MDCKIAVKRGIQVCPDIADIESDETRQFRKPPTLEIINLPVLSLYVE